MNFKKSVVVTQLRLTHYRSAFFEALHLELNTRGIRFSLLHGQPDPDDIDRHDQGKIEWATRVKNRYCRFGKTYLAWQPFPSALRNVDLIVITQENRILSNYLRILRRNTNGPKVAFWGHGANLQSNNPNGLKERFKRWTTRQVDWWFAYTQLSADLIAAAGFPSNRITVLNNAMDTAELRRQLQSITLEEENALRESLGFGAGLVGVFVGSLYAGKRLDFLFAAAEKIRRDVPDFHLLIVGDGPERDKVQAWCAAHPWVRSVGARFGKEKAAYVSLAQVMLNPGLVGLGILDAFVCGVPMLTTNCGMHGPEIAYLDNGCNGVMTEDDLKAYADACVRLLRDPEELSRLRAGCAASADEYTVENMVRRFADGIESALGVSAQP